VLYVAFIPPERRDIELANPARLPSIRNTSLPLLGNDEGILGIQSGIKVVTNMELNTRFMRIETALAYEYRLLVHSILFLISVHDFPKQKSLVSIRTTRFRPVVGMVKVAGQTNPCRQSSGTQNKSPPSGWCTQPFESGTNEPVFSVQYNVRKIP
jgi:hypothetical protein